jgi:hypothetical protein
MEEGPYALSDTRSSNLGADAPFAAMPLLTDQEAGSRLSSKRSFGARGQDLPTGYAVPVDTTSVTANMMGDTPSSMQAASLAVMSAPTTRSTPAFGPTQARPFDNRIFDNNTLHNDTRGMYDDIRDVSYNLQG